MIRCDDITYNYPFCREKVLRHINCEIRKGEAVLFTGQSGCGKSTLLRVLNGLVPHYFQGDLKGSVSMNNCSNQQRDIPEIAREVGSLFQDPEQQFFTLDVESELAFTHEQRGVEADVIKEKIASISKEMGIDHILSSSIFEISQGEKQKTALASVMSLAPEVLLLDEPTANLDPGATVELGKMIAELKKNGLTIIIVDHRLYWLQDIIDKVFILENGEIAELGERCILGNEALLHKFGLRQADLKGLQDRVLTMPTCPDDAVESVKITDLTFAYRNKEPIFKEKSFLFPAGKVTAITGHNGCGKTTLARILTGLNKIKSGQISINGKNVNSKELVKRAGLVFQNSDHQLFMDTVERELLTSGRHLPKSERLKRCNNILIQFNLTNYAKAHPQALSGGQKQRLVIACALMKNPEILILDEPTSGLDGRNMQIISTLLRQAADNGACVIVITHDLELIDAACDYRLDLSRKYAEHGK